jgi:hypothetical protein
MMMRELVAWAGMVMLAVSVIFVTLLAYAWLWGVGR